MRDSFRLAPLTCIVVCFMMASTCDAQLSLRVCKMGSEVMIARASADVVADLYCDKEKREDAYEDFEIEKSMYVESKEYLIFFDIWEYTQLQTVESSGSEESDEHSGEAKQVFVPTPLVPFATVRLFWRQVDVAIAFFFEVLASLDRPAYQTEGSNSLSVGEI